MPPDPPISFCTSRGSSYERSVPMLCPSNGDVLATPLVHTLIPKQLFSFHKSPSIDKKETTDRVGLYVKFLGPVRFSSSGKSCQECDQSLRWHAPLYFHGQQT